MMQIMTKRTPGARSRAAVMIATVLATSLVAACGASRTFRRGQELAQAGDLDTAVAMFRRALQDQPDNPEIKIELERTSQRAALVHMARARALEAEGQLEEAILEYRRTVELDPSSRPAVLKAAELERIVRDRAEAARPRPKIDELREQARRDAQPPLLRPTQRIPLLRFNNASTQDILNFVASATGINIIYERDFKPTTFTIQLDDVTLEEALGQIMSANQLWYKVVNDRTILVINDTTQKRQQYEEQVVRTFYISHAEPQEMLQMLNQITRVQGIPITPTIALNKAANTITVRATRGVAEIIERIITANDKPRAEITVDVEILEVNRARAKQYGLNLSQYSIGTIFSPEVAPGGSTGGTGGAAASATPPFNLNTVSQGISTADFYMSVPSAIVRFLASDSRTRLLARPQLRGSEGAKLTLNLGDEIPVPSTVFTPYAVGGAATNPLTSFTYRPVGVNLELTPRVTYEGDIIVEIVIESSTLGGNIEIAGQSLPTFGSRKVNTKLRLREGESHLLAGLLREEDRRSLRGLPGIMNLPILRQLVSDNDSTITQTDVVMLLTPHIVRTHELTASDVAPIYIGSQSNIGLTGPPQLIAPPPEEPASPGAETPGAEPPPAAVPPSPGPIAKPGVPTPPAAAAPGVPTAPAAAPAGVPQDAPPLPAGVRVPDGTAPQPVAAPGSSPLPGTTTLPPPAPAPTQVAPALAQPAPVAEETPAVPAQPAPAPSGTPATTPPVPGSTLPATAAQIVVTAPGSEFRVGGGPYTVPISIANASRVSTISLTLTFNPAVLRVRTIQEGSFLRQGGIAVTFTQQVDAAAGRVDITMTRPGDQTGAAGAGLLAAVLFEPLAAGAAPLGLSGVATTPQGAAVPLAFTPVTVTVR